MSELTIHHNQHPIPTYRLGDIVHVGIIGRVQSVADDLIDITPANGPADYIPGGRTTTIAVTSVVTATEET